MLNAGTGNNGLIYLRDEYFNLYQQFSPVDAWLCKAMDLARRTETE